jgi:hypothetical protein
MADITSTVYQDLDTALATFEDFLTKNQTDLQTVVTALKLIGPQVGNAITSLITLMNKLEEEINAISVLPDVQKKLFQITAFAAAAKTLLTVTQTLLPSEQPTITQAEAAVDAIGGMEKLIGDLKTKILQALTDVVNLLTAINK